MNANRLAILAQPEFTRCGRNLLGPHWDEGQDAYEAHWLGYAAPRGREGNLFLLGWMSDATALGRIAIWNPHAGDCLFMLYARWESLAAAEVSAFLSQAKAFCKEKGIASLTGPMQFSTWHPYRFISKMGKARFFPGEQRLPEAYHGDFLAAGFSDLAQYQSLYVRGYAKAWIIGMLLGVRRGLAGMEIRSYGPEELPALMPELYRLSCEIFRDNFLYAPIAYADFLKLTSASAARDAALIMLFANGSPAAFAFSYGIGGYAPDWPNGPGGIGASAKAGKTAVLKTLGVAPAFRGRGLGYAVSYLTHKYWKERGARNIIHAYMKSDNRSRAMSGHFGKSIRTYSLVKGIL